MDKQKLKPLERAFACVWVIVCLYGIALLLDTPWLIRHSFRYWYFTHIYPACTCWEFPEKPCPYRMAMGKHLPKNEG